MFGQIFSVFLNSYTESLRLEERYRQLTNRLGWITVTVSCLSLVVIMYNTWLLFGLPLEGGSIEGLRVKLILWIVLTVVLVPLTFYAGMIFVYGLFGLIMFVLGQLTWRQIVELTQQAKYPEKWYKPNT